MIAHEEYMEDLAARAASRLTGERLRKLEGHLESCPMCADAAEALSLLGETMATKGEALFEPHPEVDVLRHWALNQPPDWNGQDAAGTGRHLEICATCALEVETWRRWGTEVRSPAGTVLKSRWAVGAMSAAAGLILGIAISMLAGPDQGGNPAAHMFLPASPTRTNGEPATTWRPPAGVTSVVVSFRPVLSGSVDAAAQYLFEIEGPDGRVIWSRDETAGSLRERLDLDGAASYSFPVALFRPGRHLFRVTSPGESPASATYRIAVEIEAPR